MEEQPIITSCCGAIKPTAQAVPVEPTTQPPQDAGLLASGDLARERLTTCRTCDHLRPYINQCAKCGCFVYAKVRFTAAQCPLGKW